ncbi:ABC transporter permease [Arthrobacter sp. H41]|uniref:ABC transporter permease n=1 Tax=Arthrobacter sp. H41 TaxID=1312978 RepID=UPI00047DB806|nr:polyketide antibiotic transporter [Arthrobacter sp. H41]
MRAVVRLGLVQARRDRKVLTVWILGIALLGLVTSTAVAGQFGSERERASIITVAAASPAFLFLRGLPDGTGIGSVVFFQGYSFTAVLAGLMSTLLVVRHTRADEELGRSELVGSTPVPRTAPLAATLLMAAGANLVLAVAVAAGFAAAGLPVAGSLTAGAAVGAVGLFFGAATAVLAQALPSGRSTNGAAAGLVGAAYLIRGIGDALGTPDAGLTQVTAAWPSLLSPIGWGQRSRPFTAADLVPLLVVAAAALVLAAAAVLVRNRRDLGASVLHEGEGKDRAGTGGTSLLGLAWRLQRFPLAGWCLASLALGAVAGGLAPVVGNALDGNPALQDLIKRLVPGEQPDVVDLFTTALLGIAGVVAAAAGIQTVLRLRTEEVEGRAELLLAVPRSRTRWLAATLVLAALSVTAVAATAGTAAAVGLGLSGAGSSQGGIIVAAALAHAPAAAVFPAVTSLVFATVPRLGSLLGWGFLAVGLVLGQFGELLGLPVWMQDISPFRHSSAMPVESFEPGGALALTAVALAGAGLAAYLIRRRDLTA